MNCYFIAFKTCGGVNKTMNNLIKLFIKKYFEKKSYHSQNNDYGNVLWMRGKRECFPVNFA